MDSSNIPLAEIWKRRIIETMRDITAFAELSDEECWEKFCKGWIENKPGANKILALALGIKNDGRIQ